MDHTAYDTTSILATIEHRWDVDPLGPRDARVNDLRNAFLRNGRGSGRGDGATDGSLARSREHDLTTFRGLLLRAQSLTCLRGCEAPGARRPRASSCPARTLHRTLTRG